MGKLTSNKKDKNDEREQSKKEEFQEKVLDEVRSAWPEEGTINEQWTTVRSAFVKTAENLLHGLSWQKTTRLVSGINRCTETLPPTPKFKIYEIVGY